MSDTQDDISTLNGLIAVAFDSADGYMQAAKESQNSQFSGLFISRAQERRLIAARLQEAVRSFGGDPDDEGSALAAAHRVFLNLKSLVTAHSDRAIVNEVEANEAHIKLKFEDALSDMNLSPDVRTVIQPCYLSVKAGHDEMLALKHSLND